MQHVICSAVLTEGETTPEDSVDDGDLLEFCPLHGKEDLNDLKIPANLEPEQQEELKDVIQEYPHVFTDMPGKTNLIEHQIQLTSDEPVRSRPYEVP